jgi:hypothetical protein
MPLGFKGNILTTSSSAAFVPLETVIVIGGRVGSAVGANMMPTSFDVTKDELNIAGTPVGTTNGKVIPIADGTYNVQITGIGSSTASLNAPYPASYSAQVGVGYYGNVNSLPSGWTFTNRATFSGSRSTNSGGIPTNFTPTNLGNITFSNNQLTQLVSMSPGGGFSFSYPSYTITIYELES